MIRQVVILVGGKGTRLGDLTREIPKPLLPIEGDVRFLDYLLENVVRQGFTDILLVAGHLGQQFEARYKNVDKTFRASIQVVREAQPRGTAGALVEVRHVLHEEFLLMNGDAFVDINLRAFEQQASSLKLPAVIASCIVADASRFGTLVTSGTAVNAFNEKDMAATGAAIINAGVYRLQRVVIDHIKNLPASIEIDIFPELAADRQLGHIPVSGWFLDIGLPATLAIARAEIPKRMKRPCVFFDRDNTLIVDKGYTYKPQDLQWMDGAKSIIRKLNDAGHRVIVCTNQAGVAHGLYSEADVLNFHRTMNNQLAEYGAFIDAFYYCPYHASGIVEEYRRDHEDRKPNPGMIVNAMRDYLIDASKTIMVGDSKSDIAAAEAAGIPGYLFDGGNLDAFVCALPGFSGMIAD